MEHLKGKLRTSDVSDLSQSTFNACNLLDSNLEKILSIDEIMASICSDRRKKPGKRLVPFTSSCVCIVQDHILERIVKCHVNYCFVILIFHINREKKLSTTTLTFWYS